MERARVRFTSRCGGGRPIRAHQCAAICKRYAMMRSSRPSAATAPLNRTRRARHANAKNGVRT
eukprot:10049567-Lingulodinium_polyedra.AAC.1